MTEQTTTRTEIEITYSHDDAGSGWGYRAEWYMIENGKPVRRQFTTNNEDNGLFYLNGHGNYSQDRGTGQFRAASMAEWKRKVTPIIRRLTNHA